MEFYNDSNYSVGERSGDVGDVKHPFVSLGSFYSLWKTEFAHIKVSKPSKDICTLCHCFANCHKYCIGSTANSSADETLFRPEYTPDEETVQSDEEDNEEQSTEGGRKGADAEEEPKEDEPKAGSEEQECSEIERILGADSVSGDKDLESREQMIGRAYLHVEMACAQRLLYNRLTAKARSDAEQKKPHTQRTYTLVVDYGQNMEIPSFKSSQPGVTYYYSPLSIYNLGVVDTAREFKGEHKDHMFCHVYHEGIGAKGANNVCSLIVKTLNKMGLLVDGETAEELNIIFDNCSCQNKNCTVLKLLLWLSEMRYFKG